MEQELHLFRPSFLPGEDTFVTRAACRTKEVSQALCVIAVWQLNAKGSMRFRSVN